MDPKLKSVLTSVALAAATSIATWAASKGLIPSADQSTFANDLVTAAFAGLAALIARYETRSHTPTALIAAVNNADNGVKVVSEQSDAVRVSTPLKP